VAVNNQTNTVEILTLAEVSEIKHGPDKWKEFEVEDPQKEDDKAPHGRLNKVTMRVWRWIKKLASYIGPGLVVSIAYMVHHLIQTRF
jgi:hypothetical protein